MNEIIKLLEKVDRHIIHHTCGYCVTQDLKTLKDYVQQALGILKQQPPAEEFTKEIRDYIADFIYAEQHGVAMQHETRCLERDLLEACDRLDAETEIAQKSLEACTLANMENMKLQKRLDRAEAINKEKTIALANELEDCKPYAGALQMRKALESINADLLEACEYSHTLLLRKIGQATHAVALLEAAISKAKKEG